MNSSWCLTCLRFKGFLEILHSLQRSNGSGRFFSLCKISSSGSNPSKYSKFQLSTRKSLASIHLRCLPLMQSFNKTLPSFFSSEAPILSDSKTENVSVDDTQKYNVENEFQKEVLTLDEIYEHIIGENARDVVVMQLPKSVNYVEFFVIATANSSRHLIHLAESLNRFYKRQKSEEDPFRMIEGKKTSKEWQCIDFGNAVVHFMLEPVREKYQLEKLWLLGPEYDDLLRETPDMKDLLKQQSNEKLFLLSDITNSSEFVKDYDVVNPWEIEYEPDQKSLEKWDDDEDAYII